MNTQPTAEQYRVKQAMQLFEALVTLKKARILIKDLYNQKRDEKQYAEQLQGHKLKDTVLMKDFSDIVRRLDMDVAVFNKLLTKEEREIFERDVLDEEVTLQLDACRFMLADLPKIKRDECEKYIEIQHKHYGKNVAA